MRDPVMGQRVLERLGRVPSPGQREDLRRLRPGTERVSDLPDHPVRLLVLVAETDDADLPAGAAHCDQRLRRAVLVVVNALDRRLEDLRPRAEVPTEHDRRAAGWRSAKPRMCRGSAWRQPWIS